MIVEYRKVKCDNCGEEEEIKGSGSKPSGWFEISIVEWFGSSGKGRLNKEVCSEKCVIEFVHNLKEIPKKETNIF